MSEGILLGPAALIKAIAPQYIPTNTSGDSSAPGYYVKDKYCTYHGKFYKCLGTTYGTFDPTKWVETTVDAEYNLLLNRLRSGAEEDAELHLGFYLDENGDLCQVDPDEEEGE